MATVKARGSRSAPSKSSHKQRRRQRTKRRPSPTSRSSEGEQEGPEASAEPVYTLDRELGTKDFADRGWGALSRVADYISFLVDGRSLGLFAVGDPKVYERLVRLANTVKAAAQWFAFDHKVQRPRFAMEAERYLVEGIYGRPLLVPFVPTALQGDLRTGPVLHRKGGRGPGGRLHSLSVLVGQIVEYLEQVPAEKLGTHLEAFREGSYRLPASQRPLPWVLPVVIGEILIFSIPTGTLADLMREQGFRWNSNLQLPEIMAAVAGVLENADISGHNDRKRRARLEQVARRCIIASLKACGVRPPHALFRDRRS